MLYANACSRKVIKRHQNAMVFSSHPPGRGNYPHALEIYTKVAEEIAIRDRARNELGFTENARQYLRILQKVLLGRLAVNDTGE
jgi:hypothetical protein